MLKIGVGAVAVGAAASWAYLRHIMLPVGPNRVDFAQEVYAHRGCRFVKGIPENTVPAFEYAALNCASGLECDVRLCKSGQLVVFHDPILGNHVEADPDVQKARVSDMTLDDLQALSLSEDTEKKGVRICTLEEVIEVAREHDLRLLIELKPNPGATRAQRAAYIHAVLDTFKRHEDFLYTRSMVISFSPFMLYALRRADNRIAVMQLSRPDLISTMTRAESGSAPFFVRLLPVSLADRLVHFALYSVSPWVVGASAVGLPYTSYSDLEVHRWTHRNMFLYLWGPAPETCTASMRSPGVAVAVDDDYGQYFLKPRYPLRSASQR